MPVKEIENSLQRHGLLPWLIFLLALLSFYGSTLSFGFTYDDALLVRPYKWKELIDAFSHPWGGHFYRPLINFIFAAEYALFARHAWLYHLVNLLLVSAALFLFYLILQRLQQPSLPSLLSGLLWMILPGNAVICTWISTRTDSVCLLFYLLALLFYLHAIQTERHTFLFHLAALIFSGLAYLSKETAVTLPLVIIVLSRYFYPQRCRRWWPLFALHLALLFAYLTVRWLVLGASLTGDKGFSQETIVAKSFLLSAAGMIARYIEAIVSCFYPIFLMPNLITALLLLSTIVAFICIIRRQKWPPTTLFWAIWILITALTNSFDASPRLLWLPTLAASYLMVLIVTHWLTERKVTIIKLTLVTMVYLLTLSGVNGMAQNCFTQISYQATLKYDVKDRRRWPFSDLGQLRYQLRKNVLQLLENTQNRKIP